MKKSGAQIQFGCHLMFSQVEHVARVTRQSLLSLLDVFSQYTFARADLHLENVQLGLHQLARVGQGGGRNLGGTSWRVAESAKLIQNSYGSCHILW